jgi:hypothetical protein
MYTSIFFHHTYLPVGSIFTERYCTSVFRHKGCEGKGDGDDAVDQCHEAGPEKGPYFGFRAKNFQKFSSSIIQKLKILFVHTYVSKF